MGDIGVHAFHLAEFVTNLRTTEICADLNSIVAGRELDDDGAAFLRFDNGARGVLVASQICTGEENDLRLRVYGDAASLDWRQEEPNSLWLKHAHKPIELIRSGGTNFGAAARAHSRLPAGHPEGYLEAFANVYRNFAAQVRAHGDHEQRRTDAAARARHQSRAARHGIHRDRRRGQQIRAEVACVPERRGALGVRTASSRECSRARSPAPAFGR